MQLLCWTFATGAACQQRTLTPPDTWSCPTLGLSSVLIMRPISPELDLFPDFWVSNIPRYFCFLLGIKTSFWYIRGWIKKFWNYSHVSLIIRRNYIKLIQSTELQFPNFAMMFEWHSTHADMWRHHLMTLCNSDPVKNLAEIFISKERRITNFDNPFGEYSY